MAFGDEPQEDAPDHEDLLCDQQEEGEDEIEDLYTTDDGSDGGIENQGLNDGQPGNFNGTQNISLRELLSQLNIPLFQESRTFNNPNGNNQGLRKMADNLIKATSEASISDKLSEFCSSLSMATEDDFIMFPLTGTIKVLIELMDYPENTQIMLLATRSITYLVDIFPPSTDKVVKMGGINRLNEKLMNMEYIDLAEQALSGLEKLSKHFYHEMLKADCLSSVLMYTDFFSLSLQRVSLIIASNLCKNVPLIDFNTYVAPSIPRLVSFLSYSDKRTVELAFASLTNLLASSSIKIKDSTPTITQNMIELGVLSSIIELLNEGKFASMENSELMIIKALRIMNQLIHNAKKSSPIVVELCTSPFIEHMIDSCTKGLENKRNGALFNEMVTEFVILLTSAAIPPTSYAVYSEKSVYTAIGPDGWTNNVSHIEEILTKTVLESINSTNVDKIENLDNLSIKLTENCFDMDKPDEKDILSIECQPQQGVVFVHYVKLLSMILKLLPLGPKTTTMIAINELLLHLVMYLPLDEINAYITTSVFMNALSESLEHNFTTNLHELHLVYQSIQLVTLLLSRSREKAVKYFQRDGIFTTIKSISSKLSIENNKRIIHDMSISSIAIIDLNIYPISKSRKKGIYATSIESSSTLVNENSSELDSDKLSKKQKKNFSAKELFIRFTMLICVVYSKTILSEVNLYTQTQSNLPSNDILDASIKAMDENRDKKAVSELEMTEVINSLLGVFKHNNDSEISVYELLHSTLFTTANKFLLSIHESEDMYNPVILKKLYILSNLLGISDTVQDNSLTRPLINDILAKTHSILNRTLQRTDSTFKPIKDSILAFIEPSMGVLGFEHQLNYLLSKFYIHVKSISDGFAIDKTFIVQGIATLSDLTSRIIVHVKVKEQEPVVVEKTPEPMQTELEKAIMALFGASKASDGEQHVKNKDVVIDMSNLPSDTGSLVESESSYSIEFTLNGAIMPDNIPILLMLNGVNKGSSDNIKKIIQINVRKLDNYISKNINSDVQKHINTQHDKKDCYLSGCYFQSCANFENRDHNLPSEVVECLIFMKIMHTVGISRDYLQFKATNETNEFSNLSATHHESKDYLNDDVNVLINQELLNNYLGIIAGQFPSWICLIIHDFPFLLHYETKMNILRIYNFGILRHLIQLQTKDTRKGTVNSMVSIARPKRTKFIIDRNRVYDTCIDIMNGYYALKDVIEFEYLDEVGVGLGPTLEFYTLSFHEFVNDKQLWNSPNNINEPIQSHLFPCIITPESYKSGDMEVVCKKYTALGRLVGRALIDNRPIDLPLANIFYYYLIGAEDCEMSNEVVYLALLKNMDKQLYNSITAMIKYSDSVDAINRCTALTNEQKQRRVNELLLFNVSIDELCLSMVLPGNDDIELIHNGRSIALDAYNISTYIQKTLNILFHLGVSRQVHAFVDGVNDVFSAQSNAVDLKLFKMFSLKEFAVLFTGFTEPWDQQLLHQSIKPDHGYTHQSEAIRFFFEIISEFDDNYRKQFLQFITGCAVLPYGGLKALSPPLTIVCKNDGSPNQDNVLPSVMTCANYLKLPNYSTKEIMHTQLCRAIDEGGHSFYLS